MAKKLDKPKGEPMKLVMCPKSGRREWANMTRKSKDNPPYRCTKCGDTH